MLLELLLKFVLSSRKVDCANGINTKLTFRSASLAFISETHRVRSSLSFLSYSLLISLSFSSVSSCEIQMSMIYIHFIEDLHDTSVPWLQLRLYDFESAFFAQPGYPQVELYKRVFQLHSSVEALPVAIESRVEQL